MVNIRVYRWSLETMPEDKFCNLDDRIFIRRCTEMCFESIWMLRLSLNKVRIGMRALRAAACRRGLSPVVGALSCSGVWSYCHTVPTAPEKLRKWPFSSSAVRKNECAQTSQWSGSHVGYTYLPLASRALYYKVRMSFHSHASHEPNGTDFHQELLLKIPCP